MFYGVLCEILLYWPKTETTQTSPLLVTNGVQVRIEFREYNNSAERITRDNIDFDIRVRHGTGKTDRY
jgi:hypothetical protein